MSQIIKRIEGSVEWRFLTFLLLVLMQVMLLASSSSMTNFVSLDCLFHIVNYVILLMMLLRLLLQGPKLIMIIVFGTLMVPSGYAIYESITNGISPYYNI